MISAAMVAQSWILRQRGLFLAPGIDARISGIVKKQEGYVDRLDSVACILRVARLCSDHEPDARAHADEPDGRRSLTNNR